MLHPSVFCQSHCQQITNLLEKHGNKIALLIPGNSSCILFGFYFAFFFFFLWSGKGIRIASTWGVEEMLGGGGGRGWTRDDTTWKKHWNLFSLLKRYHFAALLDVYPWRWMIRSYFNRATYFYGEDSTVFSVLYLCWRSQSMKEEIFLSQFKIASKQQ